MNKSYKQLFRGLTLVLFLLASCHMTQAQINEKPLNETSEYESHSLGGKGYPFHGATTFKGKIYAVQIYNESRGSIRLVPFKDEAAQLQFDGAIDITSGGVYQDAEVIEWAGKLVVFWKNNTNGNIYLKYSSDDSNNTDDNAKYEIKFNNNSYLVDDSQTYLNFAVANYKNKLCLLYHKRNDDKIHIKYTEDTDLSKANWKEYGTVKNGSLDNIKFKGSTSIQPNYIGSPGDAWDADVWIGNNSKKESTEMLVVGRVKNNGSNQGTFEAFTYEGGLNTNNDDWNWVETQNGSCPNAFYLKLIQASIKGVTTKNTLPMQFIYASSESKTSGEVFFKEYLPRDHSFSSVKQHYCDMPYGFFGVAINNVLLENNITSSTDPHYLYRQKLYMIRGNGPTYHFDSNYALSVSSNIIKARNKTMDKQDDLFKNAQLRSLITFEGVVEGPPPTVVDNEEWYKNIYKSLGPSYTVSGISIGKTESDSKSEKWGGGLDAKVKIGPGTQAMTARFQLELKLAGYDSKKVTRKVSYEYTDCALDTSRLNATAFYTLPNIVRYDFEIRNCDKDNGQVNNINPMVNYRIMGYTMVPIPVSLKEAPFNIPDPSKLVYWNQRPCLVGAENIRSKLSLSFTINAGTQKRSLEEEVTTTSSFSTSLKLGTDIDVKLFALDFLAGFDFESTTENTIGKSLTYYLSLIPNSTIPNGVKPIMNYMLTMYMLTHESTDLLSKFYYPAMKKREITYGNYTFPMMIEGEKPFVIAWNVNSSIYHNLQSATGREHIAPEKMADIYTSGKNIVVKATAGTQVSVYTLQGVLMHTAIMTGDRMEIPSTASMQIVEVVQGSKRGSRIILIP